MLWQDGVVDVLPDLIPDGEWSYALDNNDCGHIVGGSEGPDGFDHATLWIKTPLPPPIFPGNDRSSRGTNS